jgi:hypothetical protein
MGAATVAGVRSRGRSPIFRGVLLGFGLHGFGHLGMAAAARQYVAGAATAPTMVIPYWLWARRELAKEGIREIDVPTVAVAAAGIPLVMGIHALIYKLTTATARSRRSSAPATDGPGAIRSRRSGRSSPK